MSKIYNNLSTLLFMKDSDGLKFQVILSFALNGLGVLLGFIQQIVFARFLKAELFGEFSFVVSIFTITGVITNWGMGILSSKEIPNLKSKEIEKGFYFFTYSWVTFLNLLLGSIIYICLITVHTNVNFDFLINCFISAVFYFQLKSYQELASLQYQAKGNTLLSKLTSHIIPFFIAIGTIVFGHIFFNVNDSLNSFFLLLNISMVISFLIIFIIKRPIYLNLRSFKKKYETKKWLKTGGILMILTGMYIVLGRMNSFIVGLYFKPDEVGYYSVALSLSSLVIFGLNTVNQIIGPKISEEFSNNNIYKFKKIIRLASKIGFYSTCVFTLFIIVFGKYLLSLFGSDFEAGYDILVILSIGNVFSAISGPVGLSLTMTGNEMLVFYSAFIAAIINLVLAFILLEIYGVQGIAIANAIGLVLLNLPLSIYVRYKFHYNTMIF